MTFIMLDKTLLSLLKRSSHLRHKHPEKHPPSKLASREQAPK